MKNKILLSSLFALALVLAACGPMYSQSAGLPGPAYGSSSGSSPQATLSVKVGQKDGLGSFLVDAKGMTLYIYLKDTPNTSNCSGSCAQNWPPLLTSGTPGAGAGITASLLGTTKRSDGSTQVTYNGWPLYYFAPDKQPGDTTGEGKGGVWYVLSPAGEKVVAEAAPTATAMSMPTAAPTQASASQPLTGTVNIAIANFAFAPKDVTIKVGTTVVWTNKDSAPHTATADQGAFNSGTLEQGDTFNFTFNTAGTFAYYCKFHGGPGGSGMSGTITVIP